MLFSHFYDDDRCFGGTLLSITVEFSTRDLMIQKPALFGNAIRSEQINKRYDSRLHIHIFCKEKLICFAFFSD